MTDVSEIAKQLGKRGGETTNQKHGTEYYRHIARLLTREALEKGNLPDLWI